MHAAAAGLPTCFAFPRHNFYAYYLLLLAVCISIAYTFRVRASRFAEVSHCCDDAAAFGLGAQSRGFTSPYLLLPERLFGWRTVGAVDLYVCGGLDALNKSRSVSALATGAAVCVCVHLCVKNGW